MKKYKLLNNISGWVVFAVSAIVYLLTIEPTASFWDCGEFISSAYKLEVGHPPGNPIFMMTANLFTQLTSDPSYKAAMVNSMSAIFSALTILFLFWTITHLAKRLLVRNKKGEIALAQAIRIVGCGAVGALAYTFSDTFWFSAVEGEVYAFSSLMTAIVFWLILKWEDVADEPHADRWLILIAYLMGVSIAVHLLNLLCIPAIVLVYYFKKYPKANLKGSVIALFISFVIIAVLLFGIIQGVVEVAGWFELLFVNSFGLPYDSGLVFYVILVAAVLSWGIWETMQEKYQAVRIKIAFILAISLLGIPFLGNGINIGIVIIAGLTLYFFVSKKLNPVALNAIMVGLFVIMIGYSSYALIIIRSAANTPMDQNSPEDIFTLGSYLSREQYGETPLLYGQTYVSEVEYKVNGNMVEAVTVDEGPVWTRIAKKDSSEKDRYFVSRRKERYIMRDELNTLFPRMHSKSDSKHIEAYKAWADVKGKRVRLTDYDGNAKIVIKPTFVENIRFFLNYQVNFMYIRYFMWNFSGRQNDIQGHGEVSNGNWITGIKFIDNHLAGPQDDMPDSIAKNKGHNVYYMLPLLLGLLGIAFQVSSGKRGIEGFWVVFLLFFMTGLAIVVYLNQPPYQPRERDYAYAGSFYAFCIWIGLGVAYIVRTLEKYVKKVPVVATSAAGSLLCLLIPLQMASQNWDDHNRSKRYLTRDFGFNYLTTCEPNAVIFTMGDNDTFPLWYAQEVEGYRTDVRVCNLSYLQTDWYVDQMKRQSYESTPLPISWNRADYIQGKHDAARIIRQTDNAWDVSRALDRIKSDDVKTKKIQGYSGQMDNVPTYLLYIPVNKSAAIASGVVKPENADWLLDSMYLYFGPQYNEKNEVVQPAKTYLAKEEMMILNMLSNNKDWSRPFYYAITVSADEYVGLDPYFRQDGIAYRIVPYNTIREEGRRYDTDILYDNLMHKYRWGNLEQPGLYIDENSGRLARTFRSLFGALGANLVNEGKLDKAKEAMDYALKVIPAYNIPHEYISSRDIADTYLLAGDTVKAKEIYDTLVETSLKELKWYSRLKTSHYASAMNEVWRSIICLQRIIHFYENIDPEKYKALIEDYQLYVSQFYQFQERNKAPEGGKNR